MNVAFQFVDVVVVLVIIASTVYAAYRGFVSETLSIFAWVAAAFATLYFGPWLAHLDARDDLAAVAGEAVGYGAVFLVVVIPLSFMSFRFSEGVKNSPVGPLDRVLGGAFGVVRGLAIIGIAYLVFSMSCRSRASPAGSRRARLLPLIQESAEVVRLACPGSAHGRRCGESAPRRGGLSIKKAAEAAAASRGKTGGRETRPRRPMAPGTVTR